MNGFDPGSGRPAGPANACPRVRELLRGALIVLGILSLVGNSAWAQQRVGLPDLKEDQRVYVVGVPDEYGPLREDIARLESSSPQSYYVVIVKSTGTGARAPREYLNALTAQWEAQARQANRPFDERRVVIILLDLSNRKILVLGGKELQERFGFRDPFIERDLLQPHFFSYAREGKYLQGLRVLVGQIDRWILSRDREMASRREEAAVREIKLRGDAEAALAASEKQLAETQKELQTRQSAGLKVPGLADRLRLASESLATARTRLGTSASESLTLSQQANRDLLSLIDDLRKTSSLQAELDGRLQNASASAGEVLQAIEAVDRMTENAGSDKPLTGAVKKQLDEANRLIDEAHKAVVSNPEQAQSLVAQIEPLLRDALTHAQQLPETHKQVKAQLPAVTTLAQSVQQDFDQLKRSGGMIAPIERDWAEAQRRLTTARERADRDDRAALADLQAAERTLIAVRDRARAQYASHRFTTRTLPLTIAAVLSALAAAFYGWLWWRKKTLQAQVDTQFKGFREQAVTLMDRLDALRQRHKGLPETDPDFTAPIAGKSREVYHAVEADLNGLWDRWLKIMDTWDRAQVLIKQGSSVGIKQAQEARQLLENEGDFAALQQQADTCQERLDQLNQGHENARAALEAAQSSMGQLREAIGQISAAKLPVSVYQAETGPFESLVAEAQRLMPSDPIGAAEVIDRARKAVDAALEHARQVLGCLKESETVRQSIDTITGDVARYRGEGLKLTEPEANPDPKLQRARRHNDTAMAELRRANPTTAGQSLEQSNQALAEARDGIERHRKARDGNLKEIETRRQENRRLEGLAQAAGGLLAELRERYAAGSWANVADHVDEARALLGVNDAQIGQAAEASSDQSQQYILGATLLEQVKQQQAQADGMLQAVAETHRQLGELAQQSQKLKQDVAAEAAKVVGLFREHQGEVAAEARKTLELAESHRLAAEQAMAGRAVNWPDVRHRLESARQGYALAARQANEDIEIARKFRQELESTREHARRLGIALSQEQKDRPPANQRYRAATQTLAELTSSNGQPTIGWDSGLERLKEVQENLKRAEQLAAQDINLANGAIAEVARAGRTIREAKAFYRSGITVDIRSAEDRLGQAQALLNQQQYEQAIELAQAAEADAQRTLEAAAHQARVRRMQVERDRVYIAPDPTIFIAAAEAASRWMAGSRRGGGGISINFPDFSQGGGGGGSGGGWSSGSGGGSWTDGADQGSW